MATSFETVIDLALAQVDDYKLVKLYGQNPAQFNRWCDGFLISAIPNFNLCRQALTYDAVLRQFDSDLTNSEISILADFWVIEWFKRETQVSSQINLGINMNGGVNRHSEAQNLKEKSSYLDKLREKVYQKITDYQIEDLSTYTW